MNQSPVSSITKKYNEYKQFLLLTGFSIPEEYPRSVPEGLKLQDIERRINNIVRSEIILFHISIEKIMELIIEQYFQGSPHPINGEKDQAKVDTKANIMLVHILPKLSVNKKLKILQLTTHLDKSTEKFINLLNDLRNHVAHNDKYDKKYSSAKYKGKAVNSFEVFHQLHKDYLDTSSRLRLILESSSPDMKELLEFIKNADARAKSRKDSEGR